MEIVILILFGAIAFIHVMGIWKKARAVNSYLIESSQDTPEISIVVCAHNEKANLEELIPLLLDQQYANYEIIIVLDRCIDSSRELIEEYKNDQLTFLIIDKKHDTIHPKKFGVTQAISKARGEWILLTDADCRPTRNWIAEMAKGMNPSSELVIGFSPYIKYPGLLNQLIQYETFQTALQFMASAAKEKPYMALGRNLGYRKASFLKNGGFGEHSHVTGGDDDLLVQSMLKKNNFGLIFSEDSQVDTFSKTSWTSYFNQKVRHFSVGKYYPQWVKKMEITRWLIHSFFWLLAFLSITINPVIGLSILAVTLVVKGLSINIVSKRLGKRFNHLWLPFVDLLYVVILPLLSLRSLLVKNITWK